MKIRLAKEDDFQGLHDAHMRSIREVCAKDYSEEEIASWGGRKLSHVLEKRREGLVQKALWVIEGEGRIHGFGQMNPPSKGSKKAYIHALYLAPEAIGQGLGQKLLEDMEKEARKRRAEEIGLDSTLTSFKFYEKNGYTRMGPPKAYDVITCKVPCIPMIKKF